MRKRAKFWSASSLSGVVTLKRTRDRFIIVYEKPPAREPAPEKKFGEQTSAKLREASFYPRVATVPLARSFASRAMEKGNGEV